MIDIVKIKRVLYKSFNQRILTTVIKTHDSDFVDFEFAIFDIEVEKHYFCKSRFQESFFEEFQSQISDKIIESIIMQRDRIRKNAKRSIKKH